MMLGASLSCAAVSATNKSTFRLVQLPWPFCALFLVFPTGPVLDDATLLLLPVSAPCGDMLLCDDLPDNASPRSSVDREMMLGASLSCAAVSATNKSTFRFLQLPWPCGSLFLVFTTGPVLDDAKPLLLPMSAPCCDMLLCDDLPDDASPRSSVDGEMMLGASLSCAAVSATNKSTFRLVQLPWPFCALFLVFPTGPVLDDATLLLLPVSAPCGDMLLCDDLSLSSATCASNSFLSLSSEEPLSELSPSRAKNPFRITLVGARPPFVEFCVKALFAFGCAERGLLASASNCSSSMSP